VKSPARELLELPPYSLNQAEKRTRLLPMLKALTEHHTANCVPYSNVINRVFGGMDRLRMERLEDIPFLPVTLFKTHTLASVPETEVIKVLTSSGTTGQQPSRVFLDAETASVQSAVLVKVAQHFIGKERLPMVIIDHPGVLRDRQSFSARGAGILGMSQFGHRPFYALREDMSLNEEGLSAYLQQAAGRRVLVFGFTFMVWQYLIQPLERAGARLDLKGGILVHSGGWKKLEQASVDPRTFRERVQSATDVDQVINFYGMVEQVGGVYFENPIHHLQAPIYSDVIVRDPITLEPLPNGRPGLIQVLSCLPTSYPGHSLLTEDLGVIHGEDPEGTGMGGRYFEILGRVPKAELRGCSDTFMARA
jgi:phenylacetate-coenzyme A ligase PaaK-like adenylate-forming protein